jgi:hypothetical protein
MIQGKDSRSYPRLSTHRRPARAALLITVDPINQPYGVREDPDSVVSLFIVRREA